MDRRQSVSQSVSPSLSSLPSLKEESLHHVTISAILPPRTDRSWKRKGKIASIVEKPWKFGPNICVPFMSVVRFYEWQNDSDCKQNV